MINIAVFICNTSSTILQSKLFFWFPFGLVLERFFVWLNQGTVMQTMIWGLNETYQLDVTAT